MAPEQRHNLDDMEQYYDEDDYLPGDELDEDDEEVIHGHVASDQALENVIREIIHNSRKLDGDDIDVNVDQTNVTLNGTVRTEDEKNVAGSLAQLVHGIGFIRNNLTVRRI